MSAVALSSRENALYHPKGITAATILLIVLWAVMQWNLSAFVFFGVIILFIIGMKRPLWAVAAILVSQMTITGYMIATPAITISLRLLLMLITLYIIWGSLVRKEVDFGPHARKIIIPMIILIALVTISNIINPLTFDVVFRAFRNLFVGLLFIILLPAIIENRRQLKFLCGIVLIVATASSVIGILQHYNFLGMGQATISPDFVSQMGRVPGMSETELALSYILPVILVILLTIYFARGIGTNHRGLLFIPMVMMLGGLYFTYTRSALLALGLGILSIFLFLKSRIRWEIILLIMAVIMLLIEASNVLESTYVTGRSEGGQEESSVARDILRQAGIAIALDNPVFGIGSGRFTEVSPLYASRIDPALIQWEEDRYFSFSTLGAFEPHNDFIRMWVSSGTPVLAVYIVLHFIIIYYLMYAFRISNNRFIKGLSAGMAAAVVTYVVNSFYHNLVYDVPILWILAGFSLTLAKLAGKERKVISA